MEVGSQVELANDLHHKGFRVYVYPVCIYIYIMGVSKNRGYPKMDGL